MKKSFWKNKKVLITGGTGLLGSEMTDELVQMGADVTLIVRDRVSRSRIYLEKIYKRVSIAYGDITDLAFVERVVGENEIDSVFHLAAQTIVRIANASPISTFESNIKGTWNVLEASRIHPKSVKRIVIASSDKAYGISDVLPYDETTRLVGRYPYDVSKSCTDLIAQSYWHTYKIPVSITRCGNLFGPGDLNFSRIIPGTIFSVLKNEIPVIRSDGKFVRNYFYIKDAVSGYLTIAENIERAQGEAFNLGTNERYSVLEITNMILKIMKSKLKPIIKNEATNEIVEQFLSIKKASSLLKWKASYSAERALRETIEWYKKYV